MTNYFHHQGPNDIAYEADVVHWTTGRQKRSGNRQEGITGAHCVDDLAG